MTLGVVDLRDSSNGSSPASSDSSATKEANQYQLSNPGSDDDEHHQTNTDGSQRQIHYFLLDFNWF